MRTIRRDWFRFTLVISSILIGSAFPSATTRAGERRTLVRNVLIDGDTIAAVGRRLPQNGASVVDAAGKIVMPGFVDTHNHPS